MSERIFYTDGLGGRGIRIMPGYNQIENLNKTKLDYDKIIIWLHGLDDSPSPWTALLPTHISEIFNPINKRQEEENHTLNSINQSNSISNLYSHSSSLSNIRDNYPSIHSNRNSLSNLHANLHSSSYSSLSSLLSNPCANSNPSSNSRLHDINRNSFSNLSNYHTNSSSSLSSYSCSDSLSNNLEIIYSDTKKSYRVKVIIPSASHREITVNNGYRMSAWGDILSISKNHIRDDRISLEISSLRICGLIQKELEYGFKLKDIALIGYAQGGALALHTALRFSVTNNYLKSHYKDSDFDLLKVEKNECNYSSLSPNISLKPFKPSLSPSPLIYYRNQYNEIIKNDLDSEDYSENEKEIESYRGKGIDIRNLGSSKKILDFNEESGSEIESEYNLESEKEYEREDESGSEKLISLFSKDVKFFHLEQMNRKDIRKNIIQNKKNGETKGENELNKVKSEEKRESYSEKNNINENNKLYQILSPITEEESKNSISSISSPSISPLDIPPVLSLDSSVVNPPLSSPTSSVSSFYPSPTSSYSPPSSSTSYYPLSSSSLNAFTNVKKIERFIKEDRENKEIGGESLACVVSISGWLPFLDDYPFAQSQESKGLKILQLHGRDDDVIDLNLAKKSFRTLEQNLNLKIPPKFISFEGVKHCVEINEVLVALKFTKACFDLS